jgi:hypothetical protein
MHDGMMMMMMMRTRQKKLAGGIDVDNDANVVAAVVESLYAVAAVDGVRLAVGTLEGALPSSGCCRRLFTL